MALDNFRAQQITWDRASRKIYEDIRANESDARGRKLVVQVTNDGVVETLSGVTLILRWKSKNGTGKGYDNFTVLDASKGLFELYYTTGMLSNVGVLEAFLDLNDATGRVISEPFNITVTRGVDDSAIEGSDSFTALLGAMVNINKNTEEVGKLNKRIDSIIATPTTVSQQEIIDARQGKGSLGANLSFIKDNSLITGVNKVKGYAFTPAASATRESMDDFSVVFNSGGNPAASLARSVYQAIDGGKGLGVGRKFISVTVTNLSDESGYFALITTKRSFFYYLPVAAGETKTFSGVFDLTSEDDTAKPLYMGFFKTNEIGLKCRASKFVATDFSIPLKNQEVMKKIADSFLENGSFKNALTDINMLDDLWEKTKETETKVESHTLLLDELTTVSPSYYNSEVDRVINDVQNDQDGETLTFAFLTDTHGTISYHEETIKKEYEALKKISLACDFIFLGGDVADGSKPVETTKKYFNEMNSIIADIQKPIFIAKGNHDDNSYIKTSEQPLPSTIVDKKTWYSRNVKPFENHIVRNDAELDGGYFYKDFEKQKIRVITLNASDYPVVLNESGRLRWCGFNFFGYGNLQLNWLAKKALNLMDKTNRQEWSVVILSHMTPDKANAYHGTGTILTEILNAYESGTAYEKWVGDDWTVSISVDFTQQGAMPIIGYFSGHVHNDTERLSNSGKWSYITTTRGFPDAGQGTARSTGAITEAAFDVVTINQKQGSIKMKRFGYGLDRTIGFSR